MKLSNAEFSKLQTVISQPLAKNRGGEDQFLKILESIKETYPEKSNAGSGLPLESEKLQSLIQLLRIQMNRHLLNAVMTDDRGQDSSEGALTGNRSLSISPGSFTEMLKDRAIPSKNRPEAASRPIQSPTAPLSPAKASGRQSNAYDDIIQRAADMNKVAPELIRAVIRTESGFDPKAISPKGARGLMQLMPETAKDLGVKDAFSPEENIMAGARYLKSLLDRYNGNEDLALAAYNWGMGNVERNPGRLPRETLNYVARVSGLRKAFSDPQSALT